MGVYIPNMEKPKRCIEEWDFGLMGNPCKFLETDMSCLLQPESEPFDCGENYEHCPLIEIDLVRCGECEYADEYNHCKYSAWWNGNADFCSHGIRRKENR